MSVTWATVDSESNGAILEGMAADSAGNVYAAGIAPNFSGILEKETAGQWATLFVQPNAQFRSITTDPSGDVFIAGISHASNGSNAWSIWELPVGQSALSLVDNQPLGNANGITSDSAGNVFATGQLDITTIVRSKSTTTTYQVVRKLTASNGGFVAANVYQTTSINITQRTQSICAIGSGPAAGIYVLGVDYPNDGYGDVLKSTDGGAHWSVVDHPANWTPDAVVGDGNGNVYVAGQLTTKTLTGYDKQHKPIYSTTQTLSLRYSAGGNSGTWLEADDTSADPQPFPYAMGVDFAGNVYVAGDAIISAYSAGIWSTSDNYAGPDGAGAYYRCFAVDTSGNLYAGGDDSSGTLVRSAVGPAPTASAPAASTFSSTLITTSNTTSSDSSTSWLKTPDDSRLP